MTLLLCSVDNQICAGVARDPRRYLVPHPTDCGRFYSCQRNGWGGWIANLMDCPATTGFDRSDSYDLSSSSSVICFHFYGHHTYIGWRVEQ